jgi:trk system potassium uptake protein TrkA
MSALLCKKKGVRRTIAIANSSNYSLLQSSLKIDDIVDPRMTTVSTILKHVHKGKIEGVYTLDNGDYEVIEAKILESSELLNQKLSKVKISDGIKFGLVVRDKEVFVPTKETVFSLNDTVILLSSRENLTKIEELFKISPYF